MLHAVQVSQDLRPGPLSRASSNSSLSSALNLAAKDPSAPPVAPSYTSLAATARHEPLWHAAATNPAVRRASYVRAGARARPDPSRPPPSSLFPPPRRIARSKRAPWRACKA